MLMWTVILDQLSYTQKLLEIWPIGRKPKAGCGASGYYSLTFHMTKAPWDWFWKETQLNKAKQENQERCSFYKLTDQTRWCAFWLHRAPPESRLHWWQTSQHQVLWWTGMMCPIHTHTHTCAQLWEYNLRNGYAYLICRKAKIKRMLTLYKHWNIWFCITAVAKNERQCWL